MRRSGICNDNMTVPHRRQYKASEIWPFGACMPDEGCFSCSGRRRPYTGYQQGFFNSPEEESKPSSEYLRGYGSALPGSSLLDISGKTDCFLTSGTLRGIDTEYSCNSSSSNSVQWQNNLNSSWNRDTFNDVGYYQGPERVRRISMR